MKDTRLNVFDELILRFQTLLSFWRVYHQIITTSVGLRQFSCFFRLDWLHLWPIENGSLNYEVIPDGYDKLSSWITSEASTENRSGLSPSSRWFTTFQLCQLWIASPSEIVLVHSLTMLGGRNCHYPARIAKGFDSRSRNFLTRPLPSSFWLSAGQSYYFSC